MKEFYAKIPEITESEHEDLKPINKDPNGKIIKLILIINII